MKRTFIIILMGCVLLTGCKGENSDPLLPFTEPTANVTGSTDDIPDIPVVTSQSGISWGTPSPTDTPTPKPTPTCSPSETPSATPTATPEPTEVPTDAPTARPTRKPTPRPTATPYFVPIQP